MYRVMIVEDEIPIRNIIAKIINWDRLGFNLVYQADNGQMALTYLEEESVDLVITDISMPFIDGLELCKRIVQHWPDTTIVILSGHSEFDYAQKAIGLGVSNYILKPITKSGFSDTLTEIRREMDKKTEARKNLKFLRKQFYKSKDMLKNKFFNNLMMGYTQSYYLENKDILEVSIEANTYQVAVINIEGDQLEKGGFWGKDRPLLDFAVLNLTEELLKEIEEDIVFLGPKNQICIIFKIIDKFLLESQLVRINLLERISRQIDDLFQVVATIGVSDFCDKVEELSFAYEDACAALEYKVLEVSERVILKTNMEGKSSIAVKRLEEQLIRLEYSIKVGDRQGTKKIINYVMSVINYEQIDINGFRTYLMQMFIAIYKAFNDIQGSQSEVFDYHTFSQLFELNDFLEIRQYLLNLCDNLSEKITLIREGEEQSHINNAIEYIHEHFQDPLLSLESVSKELFLSEGHFSRLFKKSTGVTFVDYLTKVRLDRAKYLLANTKQKMYEISANIGYEDPNYFSYNFKKNIGKTPSEWRKKEDEVE